MVDLRSKAENAITRLSKYKELAEKGMELKLFSAIFTDFLRIPFYFVPNKGVKVVGEDWDYLIILDACRYDTFKELNEMDGKLEKRRSMGSYTTEWGNKNFPDYYDDIVYVSANPRICDSMIKGFQGTEHFHDVVDVWDFGWDEELKTVPPENVTQAALEAYERYSEKRLIIHYMQPHGNYIGETKLISKNPDKFLRTKIFNNDFFRRTYRENLKLVLDEVEDLIENLEGRIVISSDHGEAIGREPFQHPHHMYLDKLVEVPWFVMEKE